MKIAVTFGELMDKGVWADYCIYSGCDPWCINEGRADKETKIELTLEDAKQIGLIGEEV